jgi:hypothetical protein
MQLPDRLPSVRYFVLSFDATRTEDGKLTLHDIFDEFDYKIFQKPTSFRICFYLHGLDPNQDHELHMTMTANYKEIMFWHVQLARKDMQRRNTARLTFSTGDEGILISPEISFVDFHLYDNSVDFAVIKFLAGNVV